MKATDFKILEFLSEDAIKRGNISNPYIVESLLDDFVDILNVSSDEVFNASQRLAARKFILYFSIDNGIGTIKLTPDGYDYYISEKYKNKIGFN